MELILAKDINNGISKNGIIPWKSAKDMKHFYDITSGNIVIMGKNTYFSLPIKNRPLKDRLNIVLTNNPENYIHLNNNNVIFTNNDKITTHIDKLLANNNNEELFPYLNNNFKIIIIGGKQIYEKYINECSKIWLTIIKKDYDCDLFFDFELETNKYNKKIYYDDVNLTIYEYNKIINLETEILNQN